MSKVGGWFKAKRVRGRAYLAEKNPVCTPSNRWWIYIMIAYAFAARAAVIFKQLNRHSVTVSMQREYLKSLMLFYIECVGAKVATLFIDAINDINEIVAKRDLNNRGADFRNFKTSTCCNPGPVRLRSQKECLLLELWILEEIDLIEQEHGDLLIAVRLESALKSTLDSLNGDSTFDESWGVVKYRFKYFQRFCGGVATVFSESFRSSITDLSLEGVLHCKQMKMISHIVP
ncbi:hypothetical protein DD238_004523 [Peronospora effusa]|uniref:Uncharacterized protein n=1 Tax=Peronospora effusa TaxID=542832 RepID=A0A3M6VJM9_9STRA|nr:hypothetical protein DD238_004523 [Peronospora effusa]